MAPIPKRIKNRKNVSVNKRNRKLNLFYLSPIRTLTKKLKVLATNYNPESKEDLILIKKISRMLTSKLDKATKRGVIHKNTAANKKFKNSRLLKRKLINIF